MSKPALKTVIIIAFSSWLLSLTFPYHAYAQLGNIGYTFDIADSEAVAGDIVITAEDGKITRSTQAFDNRLFGIVQDEVQSIVVFKPKGSTGKPISRSGVVEVNVTTLNGPIKPGDYITSSSVAGKGQKATISGYVVGLSMGSLSETEGAGKIPVAIQIEFADINTPRSAARLLGYFNSSLFKNIQDPEKFANVIKFMVAGAIAIGSFLLGFLTFARSIPKGVEAVGRNPLAKGAIQFSMILNIIFTIAITAVGIVASVLIIRL